MRLGFVMLLLLAAFAACSDDDPRYGPPGGITGRTIDFDDASTVSGDAIAAGDGGGGIDTGVPAGSSAIVVFAALYATITDPSTPPANSVCIPCHRDTQSPMFVKTSAELTRTAFLGFGFDNLETGRFFNKGQHEGNPLTPLQQALTKQWSAAEHGATDAGGE